jgi:hypothetical protein
VELLLALINILWQARVAPRRPEDCACTCLFGAIEPDGSGVVAQLGDGLLLLKDVGGAANPLLMRPTQCFTNETGGLGVESQPKWETRRLQPHSRSVVLCTDGVADDLLPERLDDFAFWLIEEVRAQPTARRRQTLASALREWPTPNHLDDKTIAVLHARGTAS